MVAVISASYVRNFRPELWQVLEVGNVMDLRLKNVLSKKSTN